MSVPLRLCAVLAAASAFALAGASAAQAHVRVIPESTSGGGFTKLTFRVPNESDTASTTELSIKLPEDTPFAFVSAQRVEGWKVKITTSKLPTPVTVEGTELTEAASTVVWTAEKGHELGPGEFGEFSISGGPLPTEERMLAFPAEQTYSDGKVVAWDQAQAEGAEEPEHPVPAFEVTAAQEGDGHGHAAAASAQDDDDHAEEAAVAENDDETADPVARWLGATGLVVGVFGLVVGLLGWRRGQTATGRTA